MAGTWWFREVSILLSFPSSPWYDAQSAACSGPAGTKGFLSEGPRKIEIVLHVAHLITDMMTQLRKFSVFRARPG